MKKKFNKFIMFIISVFSFIPFTVHALITEVAIAIGTVGTLLVLGGLGASGIIDGKPATNTYDSNLALMDHFETGLPLCNEDTYVSSNGVITSYGGSGFARICLKDTAPNLDVLIEYLPYLTRYEYKLKGTEQIYYVFDFTSGLPYLFSTTSCESCIMPNPNKPHFTISLLPEDGYITTSNGEIISLSKENTNTTQQLLLNKSYHADFTSNWVFTNSYNNPYFDITIRANYDLKEYNSDNVIVNATTEHIFGTDLDIVVPKNYYVDLFPKGSSDFKSFVYTNNFFYFDYSLYDKLSNQYTVVSQGALSEMSVVAMGGFNWLYWNIEFSESDLLLNPVISVYNPSENELTLKIKSSDFDYSIRNKDSGDFCLNGICYVNRYYDLYNKAHSFNYVADYDIEDYNNGLSFIKNIPNMVKSFISSFAFIGTLFTTFFSIITGDVLNYFYILFGIMIIMLVIRVLK